MKFYHHENYHAYGMSVPGCKKCEVNQKQQWLLISNKAKKLNILLKIVLYLNGLQGIFTTIVGFVTCPPYLYYTLL